MDVPLLAQSFLKEFAKQHEKNVNDFQPAALEALMNYSWPGNVRELRSEVERAVVLAEKDKIELTDLSPTLRSGGSLSAESEFRPGPLGQDAVTMKEAEKQIIIRALKEANGNRTVAAKKIGVSRRTLHRKLHLYHLDEF
jgi:DNA-binding NtrC family response regulator